MANQWTQIFTVRDILSNKQLKGKMPYIQYKEKETETGEVSKRTQALTVRKQVFDTATNSASPFYSPLVTQKVGDQLILDGNLTGDHDQCVDAVYTALKGIRAELIWTANTTNILRYAMKETERNKRTFGIDSKLYLRVQSMEQIQGMSMSQRQALLKDIVDNVYFGDDFPETQKKFKVDELVEGGIYNYKQEKENWKRKVGAL